MPGPRKIPAADASSITRARPASAARTYRPTEKECQATIRDACARFGWLMHHTRPAADRRGRVRTHIQGDVGFPDLVLVHPKTGRTLFVELKRRPRVLEPEQAAWGHALIRARQQWRVIWVPEELDAFVQDLYDLSRVEEDTA